MAAGLQRINLQPGLKSSRVSSQSVAMPVNMYAEASAGKGPFVMTGYPGRVLRAQMPGKIRGMICPPQGGFYVVAGQTLYSVLPDWSYTAIGTIEGDDLVEIVANRVQIGIVAAPRWYVYQIGTATLHEVTTTKAGDVFPGAYSVAVIDNIGIVSTPSSDRFYFTEIDDFRTVRDLSFATAESKPDDLLTVRDIGGEFLMGGPRSIEFWVNTGVANFPYERRNVVSDYGVVSRDSCRKIGDAIAFLGTDASNGGLQVYVTAAYEVSRISNHAVERILERSTAPDRARATVWRIEGHAFYELTLDSGSVVYDAATAEWHVAASGVWDYGSLRPPPSRITAQAWTGGRNVLGTLDGALVEVGFEFDDDAGSTLARCFTTPALGTSGRQMAVFGVGLELDSGIGPLASDPQVWMLYSGDGGKRWGRPQVRSAGREGRYKSSVTWGGQGQNADNAMMFGMTDGSPFRITGAWADVEATDIR